MKRGRPLKYTTSEQRMDAYRRKLDWDRQYRSRPQIKKHYRNYHKKYYPLHGEKLKIYQSEYRKKLDVKKRQREYAQKYYQDYYKNPEKYANLLKNVCKYAKTEKGLRARAKRRRQLGFNVLFENKVDEPVDWHHINDIDVIALPRDLHRHYCNGDTIVHRENLKYIVEQLYPITQMKKDTCPLF